MLGPGPTGPLPAPPAPTVIGKPVAVTGIFAGAIKGLLQPGGFGGNNTPCSQDNGGPGGSGGGGGGQFGATGGSGNAPPVSPAQGTNGGNDGRPGTPGSGEGGAGGGGAACAGSVSAHEIAGPGGLGSYIANSFIGPTAPSYGTAYSPGGLSSSRFFAGGGGGATTSTCTAKRGSGGDGGGGRGAVDGAAPVKVGCNGTVNTGGGGGGGGPATSTGGTGGSGIVMIRYKFQN